MSHEYLDAWAELRKLTVACQTHLPMRSCQWCDGRFAKIRDAVERLRDPEIIRQEREAKEEIRRKIANVPIRRLPPRRRT